MVTLFTTIVMVCGKVNFTNLSRYSELNERTYRRQYEQQFEFAQFNQALVNRASQAGGARLAVMDCSFVAKSGKATFGLDAFWNGTTSRVETGLEVSVVGVVDVATEQGYAMSAEQTYAQSSISEFSRMDQYLYQEAEQAGREEMLEKVVPLLLGNDMTVEQIAEHLNLPIEVIQRFVPQQ